MRALKIAGAAIATVIVVIALLLVIGVPSGFLTSAIQERVERDTGYKLAINGSTKIGIEGLDVLVYGLMLLVVILRAPSGIVGLVFKNAVSGGSR